MSLFSICFVLQVFAKLFFLNKKAPISTSMNRKFFHLTRSNPGNGTSFHKYEFAARLRISLFQAIGVRHDDDSFKCYSTLIDFPENVFFEGNKKFPKKIKRPKILSRQQHLALFLPLLALLCSKFCHFAKISLTLLNFQNSVYALLSPSSFITKRPFKPVLCWKVLKSVLHIGALVQWFSRWSSDP